MRATIEKTDKGPPMPGPVTATSEDGQLNRPSLPSSARLVCARLTFGVRDHVQSIPSYSCSYHRVPDHAHRPIPVMLGCVGREESLAGWGDVRVSDVGQDRRRARGVVEDHSRSELVGRSFETQADEWLGWEARGREALSAERAGW